MGKLSAEEWFGNTAVLHTVLVCMCERDVLFCYQGGERLPFAPLRVPEAGPIITLTQDRFTGEKEKFNLCAQRSQRNGT